MHICQTIEYGVSAAKCGGKSDKMKRQRELDALGTFGFLCDCAGMVGPLRGRRKK